jgi:hypothetical protein
MLLDSIKAGLTRVGAMTPQRLLIQVQAASNYLQLGRWAHDRGFVRPRVRTREAVWDAIMRELDGGHVLYLEFGVAYGESLRYWASHLKSATDVFHGFDSFEGLPQGGGPWEKGRFDAKGCVPDIADERVRFFKGWFEDVLPAYSIPPHDTLILNMDADLYSSTIYVLRCLQPYIRPGTFIYFDEINHIEHEARAFDQFVDETGLRFELICADTTLAHAAFRCVGAAMGE